MVNKIFSYSTVSLRIRTKGLEHSIWGKIKSLTSALRKYVWTEYGPEEGKTVGNLEFRLDIGDGERKGRWEKMNPITKFA